MALRGAKPKPYGQAVTRTPRVHEWTEVPNVPFTGGPKLPRRGDGRRWPARTVAKWAAWRSMPHCVLWAPADWAFALDGLELAARFHESPDVRLAAELRAWEKVLGTTADARLGQRIRYVDPAPAATGCAAVAEIADYRNL